MKKFLCPFLVITFLMPLLAFASDYYAEINGTGESLKQQLHNRIKDHHALSYDGARSFLFGDFYLQQQKNGEYYLHDVYCQRDYLNSDFPGKKNLGPGKIPDNSILNCEHTWPKSRFGGGKDPKKAPEYSSKVSDLHHLFPSDSVVNAIRGNSEFGEVDTDEKELPCDGSKFGRMISASGKVTADKFYEPPQVHKGNVARALFYFSVRYNMPISASEEKFLRRWHQEDPVDAQERLKNDRIEDIQNNRNPFIDHPEYVDLIENF